MANIIQPEKLQGRYVNLREVRVEDAEFIFDLRRSEKARYLDAISNNVEDQINYIKNYLIKDNEWYFIVENKKFQPLGTLRISHVGKEKITLGSLDIKNNDKNYFVIGAWLMIDNATSEESIEGEYLLKRYAFEVLNLEKNYFDVRKGNKRVLNFHKMYGASVINEDDENYYFELTKENFLINSQKFLKMIYQ
ncbi:N-acetyltransferase [Campylobacter lanienae]|uniref:GNAT family N-acetyltransferase n=1 Tax=Campylobacter lanienae TaxID=75658 RepID=UPI0011AD7E32|nr:N-acetyltransferase [Campylobacter lanienae]TWO16487.1 N-acetyltransferase [Campylobacter lanienae]